MIFVFFSDGLGVISDPFEMYESISSSLFYHPDGQADTEPHDVPGVGGGHGDRPHLADQCDSGHPGNSCVGHAGDGLAGEEYAGEGLVSDEPAGYVHVGDEHMGVDPVHLEQPAVRDHLRSPFDRLEVSPAVVKQNINPPSSYDHVVDMWCKGTMYISTGPVELDNELRKAIRIIIAIIINH